MRKVELLPTRDCKAGYGPVNVYFPQILSRYLLHQKIWVSIFAIAYSNYSPLVSSTVVSSLFHISGVTFLEGARGQGIAGCPIQGFHVTSYQATFASHSPATAMMVSFYMAVYRKIQRNVPLLFI